MASQHGLYDEMETLRAENKQLSEEVSQCQADKEFVWSLWKRLQVANPDITQAISLVVQREKEKAEIKDRKVLEILQIKDTKIEELKNALASRAQENASLSQRRQDFQLSISQLEDEKRKLEDKVSLLSEQLKNRENRERSLEDLQKQIIQNQEKDRSDFEKEATSLQAELRKSIAEKNDILAVKIQQENTISLLQKTVASLEIKVTEHQSSMAKCEAEVQKYRNDFSKHSREIEEKNRELESVRKELSDIWDSHRHCEEHATEQTALLQQVKQLQEDTERIVANQEAAYKLEMDSLQKINEELTAQYNQLKGVEGVQRQQLNELKQQLSTREDMLKELESRLESALRDVESSPQSASVRHTRSSGYMSPNYSIEEVAEKRVMAALERNVDKLKDEVHYLRDKLKDKNRVISRLERHHSMDDLDISHISQRTMDMSRRPHTRCRSAPSVVKPSITLDLQKKLSANEQRLESTRELLDLKKSELKTLQVAHQRRLDRLRALQTDYRLVREQLKVAEEELRGPKPKRKKIPRATPKQLQKEQNTESLWNELTHFKNDNKNLMVEKMNLEEEVDNLRVKASQDTATIHELKLCLDQEKDELEYLLKKQQEKERGYVSRENLVKEKEELNLKIEEHISIIRRLEDKLTRLQGENKELHEEKRSLRSEVNNMKQVESQRRIETADLRAEIVKLEKNLERHLSHSIAGRNSSNNHRRTRSASPIKSTPLVKKYQHRLNRSIEQMSAIFNEFDERDWEELSDNSESETIESEPDSGNSLGRKIVQTAVGYPPMTSSPNKPLSPVLESSPLSDVDSGPELRRDTRDMGTSPIKVSAPGARVPKRRTAHTSTSAQVGPLKQRLGALQTQLTALRGERSNMSKTVSELRQLNEQLQSELAAASQRAKMNKQNMQKLTSDIDKLQFEKDDLERQLAMKVHVPEREHDIRNTQDWQRMEQRLKTSQAEVSRQSAVNRNLRDENLAFEDQISSMKDKMNRLERDVAQKRILLDDLRLKLKLSHETARSEILSMGDLEGKLRSLTEISERHKIQNKSLEKRLQVVSKEKKEYEESYYKLSSELEKKTKLLSEVQLKRAELEAALNDVEHTAKDQLQHLANQSEAAVEAAQAKLQDAHTLVHELQNFVKALSTEILRGVQNARLLLRQQRNRVKSEAKRKAQRELERAQDVAKNILNINQQELDELMDEEEQEKEEMETDLARRKDRKWMKKWERLITSQPNFAGPLVEVMMEKVEERIQLMSRLRL